MTLLSALIFVFICFAIAAGALIWIFRIREQRMIARRRAEFAEPEYEDSARIHRVIFDASGVPIECTPVVYGCPFDEALPPAERTALAEHLRTTPSVDEWLAARGDDEVTEVAR